MGRASWHQRGLLAVIGLFASVIIISTLIASAQRIHKPFPGFFVHENLTVGPYFLPHWSGKGGGVEPFDRVLSINGQTLSNRNQVYDSVKNSPVGTVFRYRIMRGSTTHDLTLSSMLFSFHDWFLTFGVFVLVGIAFLVIGAAPTYYSSSSPAAAPLCVMVTSVFIWFGTTFDFMTTSLWPKELRIFALAFTPSAGIHLGLLLITARPLRRSHPTYLVLIYGISVILGWLYSVTFVDPSGWWLVVFRATYVYSCLAAIVFLWLLWLALQGPLPDVARSRFRVILVGAILGFFLPTLSAVLTSSFHWGIPYNLALIPTIFFPLSVAYGLLKYSLFDLGNALKVGLSRLSLMAFLLVLYAAIVSLLGATVGIYEKDPLIPLFFSLLVVLVFNPLLRWIEGVVDRTLYRQEYDPVQIQKEISLFLRSLATTQDVANGFLTTVTERMGIQSAALVYRPQGANQYIATTTNGAIRDIAAVAESARLIWGQQVEARYQGVSRGEVSTNPAFRENRDALLRVFARLQSELLTPIVFEREVRGLVSFGSKGLGREYSADDLRLLATLTDQLALSLENGRLYEESEKAKEEYRRLYDEADLAKRKLIESDQVKKQFVANICHELRTPVSTIIGYGEVLLDPKFQGDARGMLQRLVNNGQGLSQLMDSLLDFSRMEARALSNRLEAVNVKEVLGALEVMTQRLIRGRPIEFKVNVESAIETIQSDARKLQQILMQLLTNALKFTEKGEIEVKIKALSENSRAFLEISVSDTGIGIDQKDQEVIFEEFRQLDGSSTRQYGGTGLGLSLCKKLAQALGGNISVTSTLGMGSVFRLLLPVMPPQPQGSLAA